MLLVALTGNIASGKSEVARHFERRGATLIDSDELAREVVAPGSEGLAGIVQRWGREVLRPDESLDRGALRRIIFADPIEREALNSLLHPRIEVLRHTRIAEARRRGDRIVVCDVPLLFENELQGQFDCVVLVDAPAALRLDRLVQRRGLSEHEARQMMASQMPATEKRDRARYVIDNDGTLDDLAARADAVWLALEQDCLTMPSNRR